MKWFIVFLIAANNGHTGSFAFENRVFDTPDACQAAVDNFYRANPRSPEVKMICTGNHVVGEVIEAQMKKDQHR